MLLYFAYGSMCNRESLRRRLINPRASCPATLAGWTLCFDNTGGMADVREGMPPAGASDSDGPVFCVPSPPPSPPRSREAGPSSSPPALRPPYLHGVLHLITRPEFEQLAAIEAVYDVHDLPVVPYGPGADAFLASAAAAGACDGNSDDDGALGAAAPPRSVLARVFVGTAGVKPAAGAPAHLPTDRYISIIRAGLEQHGADARWAARIGGLPHERTPGPGEHRRLPGFLTREEELAARAAHRSSGGPSAPMPPPPLLPRRSRRWLSRHEGVVSPAVVFALGARVFRAELSQDAAMLLIVRGMVAGREAAHGFNQNLFDPRMPPLPSPVDGDGDSLGLPRLSDAHVAYAEHHVARMMVAAGPASGGGVEHVGWLAGDDEENDDDGDDGGGGV